MAVTIILSFQYTEDSGHVVKGCVAASPSHDRRSDCLALSGGGGALDGVQEPVTLDGVVEVGLGVFAVAYGRGEAAPHLGDV